MPKLNIYTELIVRQYRKSFKMEKQTKTLNFVNIFCAN